MVKMGVMWGFNLEHLHTQLVWQLFHFQVLTAWCNLYKLTNIIDIDLVDDPIFPISYRQWCAVFVSNISQ